MKHIFKFLVFTAFAVTFFSSCKKDENQVLFEGGTNPVLTASSTATQVLVIANSANQALSFNWTNPNYRFNTGVSSQDVTYFLQFDTTGSNFTSPKMGEKSIAKNLNFALTVKELNTILLGMNLAENAPHDVEIRLKSTMANGSGSLFSNVIKIKITPYLDVVYPVPAKLYITGAATPASWMGGGDPELVSQRFTKISTSKFEITLNLSANNSFLFVPVYGVINMDLTDLIIKIM
jgi:starch-binding outer membrane protein SusE/F